jgi:hypothetical protein
MMLAIDRFCCPIHDESFSSPLSVHLSKIVDEDIFLNALPIQTQWLIVLFAYVPFSCI